MKTDLNSLLNDFNKYIQKTDASSGTSVNGVNDLVKHKDKFKEFIQKELKADPNKFLIDLKANNIKIENEQVTLSSEFDDSDKETAELINLLLEENSAADLIDKSGDGEISNDELSEFLSKMEKIENFSVEDNFIEIEEDNFDKEEKELIENFINSDNIKKKIDKNNDGKISKEEVSGFFEKISSFKDYKIEDNKVSAGTDEAQIMQEIINGALKDEEVKKSIDSNNDGKLDEDEIKNFLNSIGSLDDNKDDLSLEDIFKAFEETTEINQTTENRPEINNTCTTDNTGGGGTVQNSNPTSGGTSGANKSGSTSGKSAVDSTEKNIENMTESELENELKDANNDINNKESNLKSILDGNDEKIKELEEAANSAYSALQEELSNVNKELSLELNNCKDAISSKEKEINETEISIEKQKTTVSNAQAAYDNEVSKKASLESAKSALESSSDSELSDSQKSDKKSKLSQIKNELAQIDIEGKKQALETAKEKLEELENKKDSLINDPANGLNALNKNKTEIENKISTLSEESPELSGLLSNYQTAQNALDSAKEQAKDTAIQELKDSREYMEKVQKALNQKEADNIKSKYSLKGFSGTYILNNTEYDTLAIEGFDSLEELQKYVINAGLTNTGQYGSKQCFNYSQEIAQIMLGCADERLLEAFISETENASSFGDIDLAGKWARDKEYNSRPFHQTKASTREAEYSIMASELNEGRPCVVSVPYTGGNHYAVAVGLRRGATEPYQASDFLIMDSYNGSIQQLGTKRKIATGNGVFVYDEGYSFKERDKALDYWSFINS